MIRNVTRDAIAARLTDVSATTRAFFGPLSLISIVILALVGLSSLALAFDDALERQSRQTAIATITQNLPVALIAPLSVVVLDWAARQPWRKISRTLDFIYALGGQFVRLIAIVGGGALVIVTGTTIYSGDLTISDLYNFLGGLEEALDSWSLWLTEAGWRGLSAGFAAFLFLQQARVEPFLAGPTQRSVLLGDIAGTGYGARLAYVSGLPASMWSRRSFKRPSFWCFIVARPLVAASVLLVVIGLQVHSMPLRHGGAYENLTGELISFGALGPVWLASIALAFAGHVAFSYGKRLSARELWTGAMVDPNTAKPILFLRSFEDDQLSFPSPRWNLIQRWYDLWSFRRNVDEILVDEFAHYGPVVALGKPSERAPPFGAARHYSDHDDWQDIIRQTAAQAQTLVVAAGATPGLKWEYELIRDSGYLNKSLILFPPKRPGAEAEFDGALAIFRDCFPAVKVPEIPIGQALVAVSVPQHGLVRCFVSEDAPSSQSYLVSIRRFFQEQIHETQEPAGHPARALVRGAKRMGIWLGLLPWLIIYIVLAGGMSQANFESLFFW